MDACAGGRACASASRHPRSNETKPSPNHHHHHHHHHHDNNTPTSTPSKRQGFNAIRLPFIFKDLKAPATQIGGYCTGAHSLEELAARTVDPEYKGPISKQAPAPVVPLPAIPGPGACNGAPLAAAVGGCRGRGGGC